MRAIIATFYKGLNYGSMLQATAMRRCLQSLGCEARFLSGFRVLPYMLKHPSLLPPRIQTALGKRWRRRFFAPSDYVVCERKAQRLAEYRRMETPEIRIHTSEQWKQIIQDDTAFITGSDIVWQPANWMPGKFFLDFADVAGLPCFAYAASIGAPELPKRYAHAYRRRLKHFLAVGVREHSSIPLVSQYYQGDIVRVVDPTLLLATDQWDEYAEHANLSVAVGEGAYILCYFIMDDSRYWSYVNKAQESLGLQVIVLPMHASDGVEQGWDRVEDATPYEFVWLIKHASLVITDSFHACAFSVQYEKEFYLLRRTRKSEDSKYDDFLGRYGLQDRVVMDETAFERLPVPDYTTAHALLAEDRKQSLDFLQKSLEACGRHGSGNDS